MHFSVGRDSHGAEIKLYHSSSMGERLLNVEVHFGFHFHLIRVKLVIYKINLFCLPYISADPAFPLNFLDYEL